MSLLQVVTPDTVKSQQQAIAADLRTLTDGVNRCSLDDATTVQWHALQDRIGTFLAEEPSWLSTAAQANEGDAIAKDMAGWHDKLNAMGCDTGPAPTSHAPLDVSQSVQSALQSILANPAQTIAMVILAYLLLSRGKG